ncbi:MAG TPA: hypothetical protein PK777_17285, partial [Thermoguttaceae bacterium]|nr:hypothetical protein [Thermoguttaceae bacterium]
NRRISQSGNWAALCIGHTDAKEGPKPLIGFAGPFRVRRRDGRAVLEAELWIFQDQAAQLQYYPRPSPEVWIPTDGFDPDRIFLDPIAFLGADAPRLDLGMTFLYAAQAAEGWQCEKYAASFPGPGSVAVPALGETDSQKNQTVFESKTSYRKGPEPMALNPEDIQAILKAIEATDWYQWIRQQMAANQKPAESKPAEPPQHQPPAPSAEPPPAAEGKKETYTADSQDKTGQAPPPPEKDKAQKDKEEYCGPGCKKSEYRQEEELQMKKELYQLRQQLAEERALRMNTDRRRRLEQLARYYALNVDEEMELCQYGRMEDPAFEKHLERIEKYYRPLPADAQLPVWAEADSGASGPASREFYQRKKQEELSTKAAELVRRMANRGQWISYEEA